MLLGSMAQNAFAQKIEIKGTVRDASDKSIEYVNVVLQTIDSTFVAGVTTSPEGEFIFKNTAAGDYRLVLSSIGYNTGYITLNGVKRHTDLGPIVLDSASIALEGVTITGSSQISRADRKLVFPSERQMKTSTNGVNLLQELMLPRILVNPMNNEIGLSGGGELQLRINGVKAEIDEIKAIRPADIIRIEYHDNPGLRYGNAEVVLDYIVRRPETGGNFGADISQGLNTMWGNYNLYGKVNHKKSEFGFSYYMGPRDFNGMYRDNEEEFHLADGTTLRRLEKGEPSKATMCQHNLNVNYSLQASENSLFSATFRLRGNNQPHWDYKGTLYNANDETDVVDMTDRTDQSWTRPSLDLYYQQNLKNKQTLVFNVVGTYNREKSQRLYQESTPGNILTDIDNNIRGNKYSLIAEAIYEKQYSKGNALSFGLSHTQSYSNNEYRNGHYYETNMHQENTYIFGEYRGKIDKLNYRLGVAMTRFYYNQSGKDKSTENYSFNPSIVLHYAMSDNSYLRWRGNIYNASPSLGDLSDVEPWDNQKDWQKLSGRAMLRVGPIRDILQFSFTGGVNHYMSHGNHYSHTYTNWFCEAEASLNYKQFSLFWQINTNWNNFWGETLSGGENIQMLAVYYKHKNLRVGVGAFNPFTDNYKVQSENWNKFASYKTNNYIKESSRMFLVNFSYNFSFGRSFKTAQRKVNNSDNDSGVMGTGK